MAYLHTKNIVHRDIKSLNIVLDKDYHAKWCDFGLAQLKLHSTTTTKAEGGQAGTLPWMAPELLSEQNAAASKATDIWALGMVYFELASRTIPYRNAQSQFQVMSWIMQGKGETVPQECRTQVPDFAAIMTHCWTEKDKI